MSNDLHVDPTGLGGVAVGVLGVAAAAWQNIQARKAARITAAEQRIGELEERLNKAELANRRLWLWCRDLYDYAYKHGDGTPPPKQPADLFTDPEGND